MAFSKPILIQIFFASLVTCSIPALAQDKPKKPESGNADPFGDLFGDPAPASGETSSLDAIEKASKAITRDEQGGGLKPKETEDTGDLSVQLVRALAAPRIYVHPKRGCEPAGRKKKKTEMLRFEALPAQGPALVVCLVLESKVGRKASISTAIVGPRKKRVSKSESTINFGKSVQVNHIMEYPPAIYKNPGQYEYVVDIEGKTVGRIPLYTVIIDDEL